MYKIKAEQAKLWTREKPCRCLGINKAGLETHLNLEKTSETMQQAILISLCEKIMIID